jgi:hypothetical protein
MDNVDNMFLIDISQSMANIMWTMWILFISYPYCPYGRHWAFYVDIKRGQCGHVDSRFSVATS